MRNVTKYGKAFILNQFSQEVFKHINYYYCYNYNLASLNEK